MLCVVAYPPTPTPSGVIDIAAPPLQPPAPPVPDAHQSNGPPEMYNLRRSRTTAAVAGAGGGSSGRGAAANQDAAVAQAANSGGGTAARRQNRPGSDQVPRPRGYHAAQAQAQDGLAEPQPQVEQARAGGRAGGEGHRGTEGGGRPAPTELQELGYGGSVQGQGQGVCTPCSAAKPFLRRTSQTVTSRKLDWSHVKPRTVTSRWVGRRMHAASPHRWTLTVCGGVGVGARERE